MATNAQLDARLKTVETWKATATKQIDALQTTVAALGKKVTDLETWKASAIASLATVAAKVAELESGGGVDLSDIETRLAKLEALTCPQQPLLDQMQTDLISLKNDHVPEL